ncbi:SulP family inorganic anion transporter [Zoogloea oleivorans]|uniref:SulP family inorganic anion transporter n=1 Tax=Zoogloea oleivorans TaxID=1552750 RepID=A0A6C2CRT1_9RHOO|nr:SulP family inorganic anion transporter [Zoogloea oleivorans]TYC56601.1 SulP family inorganic anion transporter [Zoogloea oleivorans]
MLPALARLLPFLAWRRQLDAAGLRADLLAGFSVALVAIPQALAYAQLAGLPPYVGLYASLLPCIVGALFGSSGQLNTGPVALTSLLTATSLAPLALPGSETYLLLAVQLAMLAGILQVAFGALRLAHFADLLSHPVLHGFINACSLLICAAQLPTLLGLSSAGQRPFFEAVVDLLVALPDVHTPSAVLGLTAVAALMALRRLLPRWPGVLIVVAGLTLVAWLSGFEDRGGRVVGTLPTEILAFALPRADWGQITDLLPSAFVLALVSFLEAMSSCKVASARTGQRWDGNQELIGQGLAKLTASVCQAYPVSGSFGRSAFLLTHGARTGLASVVGALMVLAALFTIPDLITHIPRPVLAAVILVTLAALLSPKALTEAWHTSRDDGLAGTVSFVATLAFAPHIEIGILSGLILSLALLIYRSMKPRVAVLGRHPDGTWRDAERFKLPEPHPQLTILRFDGPLHFVNAATFEDAALAAERDHPQLKVLLLSCAGINDMDASGVETLRRIQRQMKDSGHTLACCGLKKQVIDVLERTGLWATLAPHAAYRTEDHALQHLLPTLEQVKPPPAMRRGFEW